ncbi:hypothetical protein [Sphingobacterium sp. UBA5670]|uniref:hypothetical protein n=1 Tax=Sphingobacterium sp. UBA5670 TaxID=1947502 RepID=UPI0025E0DB7E|nr:hypothetical protein [Sphingobacterium sp. UBA5670]
MMPNYNFLIQFDLELYEIHRTGYDPIRNVKDFWERYTLRAVQEYIAEALQPDTSKEEKVRCNPKLAAFYIHLFRALIAYIVMHTSEIHLDKVSISVAPQQKELEIIKRISDFFQRVSQPNTKS